MEYWSLEQAKLGAGEGGPLAGQVAVVTGAGGTIGAATAQAFAAAGAEVALLDLDADAAAAQAKAIGGTALGVRCDVTDAALGARGLRQGGRDLRRRRHRGLQCRRRLAGPHRRGRRGDAAQELRAQFLRPPAGGAGRGEDHAGAGHRRLPAVQRLQAGGQSGPEFRPLWPAEGGDAVPGAAIRARLRRGRHPRQCRQRRPHPLGPAHRRHHRRRAPRRAACRSTTT